MYTWNGIKMELGEYVNTILEGNKDLKEQVCKQKKDVIKVIQKQANDDAFNICTKIDDYKEEISSLEF